VHAGLSEHLGVVKCPQTISSRKAAGSTNAFGKWTQAFCRPGSLRSGRQQPSTIAEALVIVPTLCRRGLIEGRSRGSKSAAFISSAEDRRLFPQGSTDNVVGRRVTKENGDRSRVVARAVSHVIAG
jgi:hypothetical protein